MEFIKATIKNYRVHKEQVVDFDSKLTLVGGDNEKGKSTIAEAIYRALFLKADGQSEIIEAMRSTKHLGGDPEVELVFRSNGKVFTLLKKFGKKGSVTLSEPSMTTLNGDGAETMLAEIIKTKTGIQANSFRSSMKWPLLWVWQSKSGDNPVGLIGESKDRLMNKLQSLGAAAVLSSELDIKMSDKFSELNAKNYGSKGVLKVGSDLKIAQDALVEVSLLYNAATEKVENLQDASDKYENLKIDLVNELGANKAIKDERIELENRIKTLSDLATKKLIQDAKYNEVKAKYDLLVQTQAQIVRIETSIDQITSKIEPSRTSLNETKANFQSNLSSIKESNVEIKNMRNNELLYRNTIDLCNVFKAIVTDKNTLAEFVKVKKQVDGHKLKLQEQQSELGKLLNVTKKDVTNLTMLQGKLDVAKAKFEAIATSFEVISSTEVVLVDGVQQAIGKKVNFDQKFEIEVGANTKISITPGGGASLSNAKSEYNQLVQDFEEGLLELGFKTLSEASETLHKREVLQLDLENTKSLLKGLNADNIGLNIEQLENKISANEFTLNQKAERYGIQVADLNENNYAEKLAINEGLLETVLHKLNVTTGIIDNLTRENEELDVQIQALETKLIDDENKLMEGEQHLNIIFQQQESKEVLAAKIVSAEQDLQKESAALSSIETEIEIQMPGSVESDDARLSRSLEISDENLSQLKVGQARLEAQLTSSGSENPYENLNKLEAKLKIADDTSKAALKKAKAIQLLNDLFTEEQQQLANKLTQPLANKINEYLLPLFGGTVKVGIVQEAGEFKEFLISRDGKEAYNFESLSGGTKEQFSAAIRLAMAEVLSADFDNKLPVVFDDAFTNSDKGRIKKIQPMLDLAARHGLQVIVLTCHPEAYASLGAKKVMLN
ncbi:MAG: AAA family ATPase [Sediminibacterium sp.]